MTKDEAVTELLARLGITGEDGRRILAAALARQDALPTSYYELWDLVAAAEQDLPGVDFWVVYGPLNQALSTTPLPFPRDFW